MSEGDWLVIMEKTQDAVRDFGRAELRSLTRRAIHRLQRLEPSRVFGDDYRFKSLWDEYCHEMQDGPHELLANAWDHVISKTVNHLVESIPRETAVLLTILAADPLDEDVGANLTGSVWNEGIAQLILERLTEEAGRRSLDALDP